MALVPHVGLRLDIVAAWDPYRAGAITLVEEDLPATGDSHDATLLDGYDSVLWTSAGVAVAAAIIDDGAAVAAKLVLCLK